MKWVKRLQKLGHANALKWHVHLDVANGPDQTVVHSVKAELLEAWPLKMTSDFAEFQNLVPDFEEYPSMVLDTEALTPDVQKTILDQIESMHSAPVSIIPADTSTLSYTPNEPTLTQALNTLGKVLGFSSIHTSLQQNAGMLPEIEMNMKMQPQSPATMYELHAWIMKNGGTK